jgi:hypothetical protein
MNPPDWRGEEGTTYQQWDFGFEQVSGGLSTDPECAHLNFIQTQQAQQQATPDIIKNPYQESSGICVEFKSLWFITRRMDWFREHDGRDGIWQLENHSSFENFLNFIIPNADIDQGHKTIVKLQLIYQTNNGQPEISIQYPGSLGREGENSTRPEALQQTPLPQGWIHGSYLFETDSCPRYESIFIYPPDREDIYIDSITIDTLCASAPDE